MTFARTYPPLIGRRAGWARVPPPPKSTPGAIYKQNHVHFPVFFSIGGCVCSAGLASDASVSDSERSLRVVGWGMCLEGVFGLRMDLSAWEVLGGGGRFCGRGAG